MKTRAMAMLIGLGLCLMSATVLAGQMKTMTFEADDAFILPGLAAIILPDGNYLKIKMIPPKEQLPKDFQDVDLKEGDLILMLNGKRLKTIEALRNRYDSLAPADSVQFGIKRGQAMMIVSYLKPTEEQMAGQQMMMVTKEIGDGHDSPTGTATKVKMVGGGDGPEPILAMDAGVIFTEKDGSVQVMVVIGNVETELTGEPLKEGDKLVSIQGEKVTTGDAFRKQYESIEIGTKVKLVYTREGTEHSLEFVKAKSENLMMQKSGKP